MNLQLSLTLVILLVNFCAFADVKLFALRPSKSHLEYLIPVREGFRLVDELKLYKDAIRANSELTNAITNAQLDQLKPGQIRELNNEKSSRVLILANSGYDLGVPPSEGGQARLGKLVQKISNSTNLIVLPLAISINLSSTERSEFYSKISSNFSSVIALGGADVSPNLYNEENIKSRDINLTRDKFELGFLQYWIKNSQGFLYGICRGHQLIAVALGYKLFQHIDTHGDGEWESHKIIFQNTQSNVFKKIFNAKLPFINVNSFHHQAVQYSKQNQEIEIAAVAPDGIVESLVSKDGRIFTTQFHPEFMDNYASGKFFNYLNQKFIRKSSRCQYMF